MMLIYAAAALPLMLVIAPAVRGLANVSAYMFPNNHAVDDVSVKRSSVSLVSSFPFLVVLDIWSSALRSFQPAFSSSAKKGAQECFWGAATAHCLALDRAAVNEAVQLRDENAVLRECLAALWAEIEQVREHQRKQRSAGCSKICVRPATVAERVAEHAGQAHQVQMSELKVVEQAQAISRQQYEQLVQMPAVWFREHVEPVIRSELDDLGEIASCAQGNTIQSGKPLQTERSMNAGTGTNKHNADAGTMGASSETDEGALHPRRLFAASHTHTSV